MTTIKLGELTLTFPLDDEKARQLVAAALDAASRPRDAVLLRSGKADRMTGEVVYQLDGAAVRITLQKAMAGDYLAAEVRIIPVGKPSLRKSWSEAQNQPGTAALMWLFCCAVSSAPIRMGLRDFLVWLDMLAFQEKDGDNTTKVMRKREGRAFIEDVLKLIPEGS